MNIRNCTRFRKEVNNVPPRERTTVLTTTMTTVGLPNTSAYTAKQLASCHRRVIGLCLRIKGSFFIRSASATPLVARALNPQDESSSSQLD